MHKLKPGRPTVLVWTDISFDQMKKLDELTDAESINEFFIKIFNLQPNTKRTTILCDFFYYALNFARTNKFNYEQTSSFISILKHVHEMCIYTPFANMDETYQYCKALVLRHALFRPPFSLRIFTPDLTKKVTDYIVDTYFRHFKMYKYIFTPTIDFNLKFTYAGMTRDFPEADEEDGEVERKKNEDKETIRTEETRDTDKIQETEEQENDDSKSQLAEVRKLIETYLKEELQKVQIATEEPESSSVQITRSRSIKSGSGKTSKPHTPK